MVVSRCCLLSLGLLAAGTTWAQAPAWTLAQPTGVVQGTSSTRTAAVAADASGNIFVTGYFTGQATFGSTVLTSAGGSDLFVAKYVPATTTWAWALRGGGTGNDGGTAIAVSGSSLYVAGSLQNSTANANAVTLGGSGAGAAPQYGASATSSPDLLLASYTDNGTSATFNWSQVGGGTGADAGTGVAVGSGGVYLTGSISTDAANSNAVRLGGSGTTAGTLLLVGSGPSPNADWLLAKYTDQGNRATLGWTQVGGGRYYDAPAAVAVSGSSVYVTGGITNDNANTAGVLLGGTGAPGTVPQYGASSSTSNDLLLVKYTDQGAAGALAWSQVAGGAYDDYGQGVAVRGSSVYVTGSLTNSLTDASAVRLGGSGTTAGTSLQYGASSDNAQNLLLAKYTDQGSSAAFTWSQVGGGRRLDAGAGVAVGGSGAVYVTGSLLNDRSNSNQVVFGGSGTTPGTVPVAGVGSSVDFDLLVARYTDNGAAGALAWVQVGGGEYPDLGAGLAVTATGLYAVGYVSPPATFGSLVVGGQASAVPSQGVVVGFGPAALPTRAASAGPGALLLYPNPAAGPATLGGATPGAAVQVLDAQGRLVLTTAANAAGIATLDGLPGGLYLVRTGSQAARLVLE